MLLPTPQVARRARELARSGAYLDDLHRRFGYFQNLLTTVVMPGLEGKQNMARMLDLLRSSPPAEIGSLPVTGFADLRDENNWMGPIKGATDRALLDLYCVAPGQSQKAHTHGDQDKIYMVLDGRGRITVGGDEDTFGPGEAVIAPAGVEHGLVNDGPAALLVLVVVTPPPPHA